MGNVSGALAQIQIIELINGKKAYPWESLTVGPVEPPTTAVFDAICSHDMDLNATHLKGTVTASYKLDGVDKTSKTSCDAIPNICIQDNDGDGITPLGGDCDDTNGNINPNAAEVCDDNIDNDCDAYTDEFDTACAVCGDGYVAENEECDGDGAGDGRETAACDADCTASSCGDGSVNTAAGEECDDGGESSTCDADCTFATCGDTTINSTAGEECDDGNDIDTDACTNACTNAVCGDNVVYTGVEECDDGNTADGDGCSSECLTEDETPPVITCPADVTFECLTVDVANTGITGQATATDNNDPSPEVSSSDNTDSFDGLTGLIVRTWTATDEAGNSSSCVQWLTIVDTTPPGMTCPESLTLECPIDLNTTNFGTPLISDNCDPNPILGHSDDPSEFNGPGTLIRTWTATDGSGNSGVCSQTLTVVDTIPPTLSAPAPVTVVCDPDPIEDTGIASVEDFCDPSPTISHQDGPLMEGEIVRTWTATDATGNSSSAEQTITCVTPPAE